MHKTSSRIVKALCNFKDKVIKGPDKDRKRRENMENITQEGFLGCVEKINSTNIVLKNKPESVYNGEIFFIRKKNTLWISVLSMILIHGSSTFLHSDQILNITPESMLLSISKDIQKTISLPVNTF